MRCEMAKLTSDVKNCARVTAYDIRRAVHVCTERRTETDNIDTERQYTCASVRRRPTKGLSYVYVCMRLPKQLKCP